MVADTEIALIEINQSIKIKQNEHHAAERVLNTLELSKRLLILKEQQLTEMKLHLKHICDMQETGGIIKNEVFDRIKTIIK